MVFLGELAGNETDDAFMEIWMVNDDDVALLKNGRRLVDGVGLDDKLGGEILAGVVGVGESLGKLEGSGWVGGAEQAKSIETVLKASHGVDAGANDEADVVCGECGKFGNFGRFF